MQNNIVQKIGIVGLGFVGNSIYRSFIEKGLEPYKTLFGYDKFKDGGIGNFDNIVECLIIFLALPTIFNENTNCYDKESIYDTCRKLEENKYKGVVVIKSTVEPETTVLLSKMFKDLEFVHNPEFLTAVTAYEDFHNQTHIVLGRGPTCSDQNFLEVQRLYNTYYPKADISLCTSTESEMMKIFVNCFYSVKVQFFTELFLACNTIGTDYQTIKQMMLKNGWINPMHTNVPGPDGQISYGGLCFPKDTNALSQYMESHDIPNKVLKACIEERNQMRSDHDNINKK